MNRRLVKYNLVNLAQEEIDNLNIPIPIKITASVKIFGENFRPR